MREVVAGRVAAAAVTAALVAGGAGLTLVAAPVATAEVPAPAGDESVVTVSVGSDRTGTRDVAPLPGVELGLFAAAGDADPVDPTWGLCTSDADGDCSFVVPDTGDGGANAGAQYVVEQVSAPAGWYTNPTLRVGNGSGSESVAQDYVFTTPALAGGETYSSTDGSIDFMFGAASSSQPRTDSEGVWQQSRTNPELAPQCGADIALLLDFSSSLGSQVDDLKAATDSIADALVGTPSNLAVFSFDSYSPSSGSDGNHPDLVSVATQQGADEFKAQYADWTTGSGTNWDQGLWAVAQADPDYELVIMITDGNPTRFSADPRLGTGGTTHFRDVENGIYSANAVKATGSRLLALGVGSGIDDVTRLNLRALSGETFYDGTNAADADYYDLADFETAGSALRDLVLGGCEGRVNVTKAVVPAENAAGDVTGAVPGGAGWQFDAATGTPGVSLDPSSATTTDDGTGSVAFDVEYADGLTDADVTVAEAQRPGYALFPVDGENAVCVDKLDGDAPLAVTSAGDTSFGVTLPEAGFVSCTVYNQPLSAIVVDKTWVIDGVEYAEGDQPDGYAAQLTLTGPGGAGASDQDWGDERGGYQGPEDVTVAEDVTIPEQCVLADAEVTGVDGEEVDPEPLPYATTAAAPAREVVVTNRVTCPPMLTLVKEVVNDDGGTAVPEDWTLSASGPVDVEGVTGDDAVTFAPVEPGDYTLAEDGPDGYTSLGWACVDDATGDDVPVTDGVVGVGESGAVTCTVTNDDDAVTPSPTPTPTDPAPTPSEPTPAEPTPAPTAPGEPTDAPSDMPPYPGPGGSGGGTAGPGTLPVTGATVAGVLGAALVLAGAGTALVLAVRRRRSA
ncbi:VWA domain-containing protein [Isoptericola sp. BMS4]|uniref:VWA domain-containing protein n=1 Tax=Isoptericola sp. BMS4 TaxID=2527875 RepID=UPI0014213B79|nr:VWA domain-containing protein [Isoptericola sp. BMS4]